MIRAVVLSACLVASVPASAQSVEEIVARNVEARGGLERLHAIQSVRLVWREPFGEQPQSMMDEQRSNWAVHNSLATQGMAAVIIDAKRPNLRRVTRLVPTPSLTALQYEEALRNALSASTSLTTTEPQSPAPQTGQVSLAHPSDYPASVSAFDGTVLWTWRTGQSRIETMPPGTEPAEFVLDSPLVDHKAKGYRVELGGRAKAEGRDCYRIRVTTTRGDVQDLYIDAETYLDVRSDTRRRTSPAGTRTIFRDWKAVDGVMLAHTVVTTVGSLAPRQTTIETVEFNVPFDDHRFARPAARK